MADCGIDLLDDEERIGGVLRSLVNSNGLQSGWQRVSRRLQALEQGLTKLTEKVQKLDDNAQLSHEELQRILDEAVYPRIDESKSQISALIQSLGGLQEAIHTTISPQQRVVRDGSLASKVDDGDQPVAFGAPPSLQHKRTGLAGPNPVLDKLHDLESMFQDMKMDFRIDLARQEEELESKFTELGERLKDTEKRILEQGQAELSQALQDLVSPVMPRGGRRPSSGLLQVPGLAPSKQGHEQPERGPSPDSSQGKIRDGFQSQLVALIDGVVALPIRSDFDSFRKEFAEFGLKQMTKHDDQQKAHRSLERAVVQDRNKATAAVGELKAEIDTKAKMTELERIDKYVLMAFKDAGKETEKVHLKLLDHSENVRQKFTALERVQQEQREELAKQAEKLSTCATKEDAEQIQLEIHRCIQKEQFLREIGEVRKFCDWHTTKIEALSITQLGLQSQAAKQAKFSRSPRKKKHSSQRSRLRGTGSARPGTLSRPETVSPGGSVRSFQSSGSEVPHSRDTTRPDRRKSVLRPAVGTTAQADKSAGLFAEASNVSSRPGPQASVDSLQGVSIHSSTGGTGGAGHPPAQPLLPAEDQDGFEDGDDRDESEQADTDGLEMSPSMMAGLPEEDPETGNEAIQGEELDDVDDEEEETSEDDLTESRTASDFGPGERYVGHSMDDEQLRKQLEAMAMALLGLAHLVLRPPMVGGSRNARLWQQHELLEELKSLRHWVTNRVLPAGWDMSKLTTIALRCTHPRQEEVHLPVPQVSISKWRVLQPQAHVLIQSDAFPASDQVPEQEFQDSEPLHSVAPSADRSLEQTLLMETLSTEYAPPLQANVRLDALLPGIAMPLKGFPPKWQRFAPRFPHTLRHNSPERAGSQDSRQSPRTARTQKVMARPLPLTAREGVSRGTGGLLPPLQSARS